MKHFHQRILMDSFLTSALVYIGACVLIWLHPATLSPVIPVIALGVGIGIALVLVGTHPYD